jgi:UDP-glucuronate decarboxylase
MMKVLVTGGAGNIGSALVEKLLLDKQNYITIVDNLLTGSISKLPQKKADHFEFIKCDVNEYNELASVMLSRQFDYVFHFAAVVGVQRTQENPLLVMNDINGFKNILELSKNTGVKRVFFSSSSEVYGEPVELPQNEHTTPLNSKVPYAVVKNVGECFFKSYFKEYGLNYTIFRFFNTYGPNQSIDFVIAKFLKAALKSEPITIYGDGSQTRTFCYVDDTIDTCVKCLYEGHALNDVINVGSDKLYTVKELADIIIQLSHSKSEIISLPPLANGDMTRRQPNNGQMLKILDRPLITLEEGILNLMKNEQFLKLNEITITHVRN